jgi:nitrous oxide reductase
MDIEDLFDIEDASRKTATEDIVKKFEERYRSMITPSEEHLSREQERREIKKKIRTLNVQLSKNRNVKNHRRTSVNAQLAERRNRIKNAIKSLEVRLLEIEEEAPPHASSLPSIP